MWNECKSQVTTRTHLDRAGQPHMWTHSSCDSVHSIYASRSQTKFQHGGHTVSLLALEQLAIVNYQERQRQFSLVPPLGSWQRPMEDHTSRNILSSANWSWTVFKRKRTQSWMELGTGGRGKQTQNTYKLSRTNFKKKRIFLKIWQPNE